MKALWLVVGGYTVTWGLWLLSPFWGVFDSEAALYTRMEDFMPEWAWGVHALLIGVCIIVSVVYQWPRGLWWGRIASSYHWGLIGVLYVLSDWQDPSAIVPFAIMISVQILWNKTPRTPTVNAFDTEN